MKGMGEIRKGTITERKELMNKCVKVGRKEQKERKSINK